MRPNQTFKLYHNKGSHACIVSCFSHVQLFATPWTVACQPPPSMGFSRQEYWSGLPFLSPTYLPDPGIELLSPALQADFIVWATEESICQNPYINIMDQLHLFHLVAYSLPHHKQRMDTQLLRKYLSGCQTIPKLFLFVPLWFLLQNCSGSFAQSPSPRSKGLDAAITKVVCSKTGLAMFRSNQKSTYVWRDKSGEPFNIYPSIPKHNDHIPKETDNF